MRRNKALSVSTMYGTDGRLRSSYLDGNAAAIARKHVKAFERELKRYEKDFAAYASLDIEDAKVHDLNTKYVFGKLGVAEKYVDFIPEGDMADSMGDEMTAVAGNKRAQKFGIKSKIASKFQPFLEKQAAKHPRLQKLSDRVTKAANGGRMPLTADSAAMMRIAFDKKYYNDLRRPGVDAAELQRQHAASIANFTKMARFDGVEPVELSAKFAEKLINQMQIDESLTDIYAGMSDGTIRLADSKPVINSKKEIVRVCGKALYERPTGFVSEEKDSKGRNKPLDAWEFSVREPQTIDEILAEYQGKFDKFAEACQTEADLKRMLSGNSYANLERNAKTFAETDCPDDAAMFKYEFTRCNLESCKKWAIEHGHRSPYANIIVPPPWSERADGNDFLKSYSTDDYYSINDRVELHDKAVDDVSEQTDEQLAATFADEVQTQSADIEKFYNGTEALEGEVDVITDKSSKPEADCEKATTMGNCFSFVDKLTREIKERYNSRSETILDADDYEIVDKVSEQQSLPAKPIAIEEKTQAVKNEAEADSSIVCESFSEPECSVETASDEQKNQVTVSKSARFDVVADNGNIESDKDNSADRSYE